MICYPPRGTIMAANLKPTTASAADRNAEYIRKIRTALSHEAPKPSGLANEAAILVPIIERDGELNLAFIRRSDIVESHRGQVAFPGGRVNESDKTLIDTALREAWEEVGIEPASVDVLGGFGTMSTMSTGMKVAPFVGVIANPIEYRIDPIEVAKVFEVPLSALADARYRGMYEWKRDGRESSNFPAIFHSGQTIWGLTLRITEALLEILGMPRPKN
jgi:8-oxo-dGTP pyrophosphatase MutT (NUDIX family)